jgi:hypothetical protein
MATIFTAQYQYLWIAALAAALFFPVRHFIWVLTVRRAEKKLGGETDEAERLRLKRRSGVTAGLLCFVFSVVYVTNLFQGAP